MAKLDVDKMATRWVRANNVNIPFAVAADFARQVARACARVAYPVGATPQENALYDKGRQAAATAIRSAVKRGRKRG